MKIEYWIYHIVVCTMLWWRGPLSKTSLIVSTQDWLFQFVGKGVNFFSLCVGTLHEKFPYFGIHIGLDLFRIWEISKCATVSTQVSLLCLSLCKAIVQKYCQCYCIENWERKNGESNTSVHRIEAIGYRFDLACCTSGDVLKLYRLPYSIPLLVEKTGVSKNAGERTTLALKSLGEGHPKTKNRG